MVLTQQQINSLITGTQLAAELIASGDETRRFILVKGYEINEHGQRGRHSKVIRSDKMSTTLFEVRDYELSKAYFENGWDVTEDDLSSYRAVDGILGIAALEAELLNHMDDFALLVPEWKTDSLL